MQQNILENDYYYTSGFAISDEGKPHPEPVTLSCGAPESISDKITKLVNKQRNNYKP